MHLITQRTRAQEWGLQSAAVHLCVSAKQLWSLCLLFVILLVCDPLKTLVLERPGTSFFVLFARFLRVRRRDPSALFAHLPRIFGKSCACLTFTILDFGLCPVSVVVSHYQFVFFFVLCHCVRVGVPLFTGRQPSQNGQYHFFCNL